MTTVFIDSTDEVRNNLRKGSLTLAVYGLGRIGLPISVAWLRAGAKVIGVDVNEDIVESINNGESHIKDEPGIPEAVREFTKNGCLRASSDLTESSRISDVSIVLVPTVVTDKRVDLSELKKAVAYIGRGLEKNQVVIIESSVPPFTTNGIVRTILEKESGLIAGIDFGLAASPERVMSGRVLQDLARYPKIVGGVDPKSTEIVSSLYESICKQVVQVRDSTTAEAIKIFEGIYRDVNIALANELAVFCDLAGLDFQEIRRTANSQPYSSLHLPGCGVGGYCIPYYPYFLMEVSMQLGLHLPITRVGRIVNESMPTYTVSLLKRGMRRIGKDIMNQKIAIFGASFRGDSPQCKNSPAKELISELKTQGAQVAVYDPIASKNEVKRELGIAPASSMTEALREASGVIIQTDHNAFKKIGLEELVQRTKKPLVVIDTRSVMDFNNVPDDILYFAIGRTIAGNESIDSDILVYPFTEEETAAFQDNS